MSSCTTHAAAAQLTAETITTNSAPVTPAPATATALTPLAGLFHPIQALPPLSVCPTAATTTLATLLVLRTLLACILRTLNLVCSSNKEAYLA